MLVKKGNRAGVKVGGRFVVTCHDKDGKLKWQDTIENLVVNVGLQHIIDTEFESGAQVTSWYLGLTTGSPTPAAGDTMGSHAGWTEYVNYSEAARQIFNGTRTGQQTDNSGSKAQYNINGAGGTIGGAFLVSDSTKGGSGGTLLSVGALSGGNRTVVASDLVNLQYTFTAADDGV